MNSMRFLSHVSLPLQSLPIKKEMKSSIVANPNENPQKVAKLLHQKDFRMRFLPLCAVVW
jgi:hypothetical protein